MDIILLITITIVLIVIAIIIFTVTSHAAILFLGVVCGMIAVGLIFAILLALVLKNGLISPQITIL